MFSYGATSVTNSAPAIDQSGRPCREAILDHPLAERLGDDRRGVLDAEARRDRGAVLVGRRGRDAVDHRGGKRDLVADVAGKRAIAQRGEARRRCRDGAAVVRKVVAAQHGEGVHLRLAPPPQRLDQEARRGARPRRIGQVVHDVGMRLVERGGRRIVAVALLGDGQRDDLHRRIAQARAAAPPGPRARPARP